MNIFLALLIGGFFGFALDRVRASNPNYIVSMLKLENLYLMKVILFAIGFASTLMFLGQILGIIEIGHISVKASYFGVVLGGIILWIVWAVSGYCPGTGIAAAASCRIDAITFILGGLLGAFVYMLLYDLLIDSAIMNSFLGGKVTLGTIPGSKFEGIFTIRGDVLGIVIGILFMFVAYKFPEKYKKVKKASNL